jgi:hypothetical protein
VPCDGKESTLAVKLTLSTVNGAVITSSADMLEAIEAQLASELSALMSVHPARIRLDNITIAAGAQPLPLRRMLQSAPSTTTTAATAAVVRVLVLPSNADVGVTASALGVTTTQAQSLLASYIRSGASTGALTSGAIWSAGSVEYVTASGAVVTTSPLLAGTNDSYTSGLIAGIIIFAVLLWVATMVAVWACRRNSKGSSSAPNTLPVAAPAATPTAGTTSAAQLMAYRSPEAAPRA